MKLTKSFLLTLQMTFGKISVFEVYEVGSKVVKFQLLPSVVKMVRSWFPKLVSEADKF